MSNSNTGYDVVVDVDEEARPSFPSLSSSPERLLTCPQGDLGHTDLQEDLEFHSSTFESPSSSRKPAPGLPAPATSSSGGGSKKFLWSLAYYSQFFDVDTTSVLARCWAALYPRANFLDVLDGNPDLYGPFWIATTVVFILFVGGTVSQYLVEKGGDGGFRYDFRLLSGMSLIFLPSYPILLLLSTRPIFFGTGGLG